MEFVPVIRLQETECQGCYKLAGPQSCDGCAELSDWTSQRIRSVIKTMNSSDLAQPQVFRRRKSSVWSINAESRTDNGLEKFIELKKRLFDDELKITNHLIFVNITITNHLIDFETGK